MDVPEEQLELMAMMGARRGKPLGPHHEYYYVPHANVHRKRRQEMLKKHPEVVRLNTIDPMSKYWGAVLVALQVLVALALSAYSAPLWVLAAAVLLFGAFVDHALWVLLHDFIHGCGATSEAGSNLGAIMCNAVHVLPSAMGFKYYHLLHHGFLNTVGGDPDLPDDFENRWMGQSSLGKAGWLLLFPFFQLARVLVGDDPMPIDVWVVINWVTSLATSGLVLYFGGLYALAYLFLSSMFAIGLHPVGARWIAEHYSIDAPQETYSTYGIINKVAFNIGYHNEHHDFPNVPWSRLPALRAAAPEFYDHLTYHTSYIRVLLSFIFHPAFSLNTRVVRAKKERG